MRVTLGWTPTMVSSRYGPNGGSRVYRPLLTVAIAPLAASQLPYQIDPLETALPYRLGLPDRSFAPSQPKPPVTVRMPNTATAAGAGATPTATGASRNVLALAALAAATYFL